MTLQALTLWRPWDHSIVHGPKRVENRPWRPPRSVIGTDIALHAGQTYDKKGAAFIRSLGHVLPPAAEHRAGVIVGVVRIVRAVNLDRIEDALLATMGTGNQPAKDPVEDDPWAFGPWVWVLDNVRPLATPVPCKGAQGLWPVPPDVEAEIRKQIA